ncbi:MAG: hypothetical protein ABFS39_15095 [Pseudomonadota bacterium]
MQMKNMMQFQKIDLAVCHAISRVLDSITKPLSLNLRGFSVRIPYRCLLNNSDRKKKNQENETRVTFARFFWLQHDAPQLFHNSQYDKLASIVAPVLYAIGMNLHGLTPL